ncbi:hypothetical protein AXFE_16430 [Acidithrix ferrooxidans]|uniref:Uncharacterized protein n=1 Tax=Acidithrix ferrooxidans TaxID=1280514 RepID=A0A0D8HHL5_9ACTN|nr:hypothetical protein AXFE_16430 [Acidithrix ferrooxidans]
MERASLNYWESNSKARQFKDEVFAKDVAAFSAIGGHYFYFTKPPVTKTGA